MIIVFSACRVRSKSSKSGSTSTSSTSKYSKNSLELILEKLKGKQVRTTTSTNYLAIWRSFNQFLIKLDKMPNSWEDRTALFCAHLVNEGNQSQTLKSYVSAIKSVLKDDGYYEWNEEKVLLSTLTRACKLENDKLTCRFPIQKGLFELIIFQLRHNLIGQFYLETLYRALFCLAYYGLMRIGELAEGSHAIKACNIHTGTNKDKILVVLYSSKTHGQDSHPQKIKITSIGDKEGNKLNDRTGGSIICPFQAVRDYLKIRGGFIDENENFFVFRDRRSVQPSQVRTVLRECLNSLSLDSSLYNTQSFRSGRTVDLWKGGMSMDRLKSIGRWRSNAVYRYLKL